LEYDIWVGETTNDQLKFDISEFWNTDFSPAAANMLVKINAKQAECCQRKEQDERALLARLKEKYEA
jgi:hypothetical protein